MLFRSTVAGNCENHTKHTNPLCEPNVDSQNLKADNACAIVVVTAGAFRVEENTPSSEETS
jgi:hypothetical protein